MYNNIVKSGFKDQICSHTICNGRVSTVHRKPLFDLGSEPSAETSTATHGIIYMV